MTFTSVDEILVCDHSNESYWTVVSSGAVCFWQFCKMKFKIFSSVLNLAVLGVKGLIFDFLHFPLAWRYWTAWSRDLCSTEDWWLCWALVCEICDRIHHYYCCWCNYCCHCILWLLWCYQRKRMSSWNSRLILNLLQTNMVLISNDTATILFVTCWFYMDCKVIFFFLKW